MRFDEIFCEACHRPADEVLIHLEFSKDGGTRILCESCERHRRDGILREEYDEDGKKYWRAWTYNIQPMTPTDYRVPAKLSA